MKHSPLTRLANARVALQHARNECAHWDCEDEPTSGRPCCDALLDAIDAFRRARGAVQS